MKKILYFIGIATIFIGGFGAFLGYQYWKKNYTDNVAKSGYLFIPHKATFEQIMDSISPFLKNPESFRNAALDKNMNKFFHSGRYSIKEGKTNRDLINMIKVGNQVPYSFRIGDFYDVYQMIGRVSRKTQADSLEFAQTFNQIAHEKGYENAEDLKKYFFVDTYDFFWSVTPEDFFKTFENQYNEFWNSERKEKEKQLNLSREQIYALASIVFKESGGKTDEQKTIAGLYLNRYKKGMKLQSDPTVIYAVNKSENFKRKIKRVLYRDLKVESPYNTYLNPGIPPGPICMVDKNSVDAVLNAEKNNYIYMCADPNRIGFHKFTASDREHAQNAKEYQNWLNSKNIKK